MRRLTVALTCLVLAPGLAGLAACSASDVTAPPAATSTVSKLAGGEGTPALGPGQMAYFLLEGVFQGAGAQGYNFLSDLLTGDGSGVKEDATTAKLDGISSQLTAITTRLDTVDKDLSSLRAQVTAGKLSVQLTQMDQWNNSMITLYDEYFLPVLDAAQDVRAAKTNLDIKKSCTTSASTTTAATPSATPSTPASATTSSSNTVCSKTQEELEQDLKDKLATLDGPDGVKVAFKRNFELKDPYTVSANQHDQLYPKAAGEDSVLKLAGANMQSKGYTTWADSQKLNALYLSLSDQEAFSALLVFEHDKMFGLPAGTQKRHYTDYRDFNDLERANLPKEIPWGQVKVGNQMFMVPADQQQREAFGPWLPISPEGKQLGTFDPMVKVTENPGWSLPTAAQLGSLHEATKNVTIVDTVLGAENKGPSTHLGSIWKNSGNTKVIAPSSITMEQAAIYSFGQPWFWASDTTTSGMMACYPPGKGIHTNRYYTLHYASFMGGDVYRTEMEPATSIDEATGNGAECDTAYENPNYAAATMLTQPIPDTVDYMAQRTDALPAPSGSPTTTGS